MNKKENNVGPIISAALGAAFFAVPYVGLGISLLPSLGIAVAAFGAGSLIFSNKKVEEINDKELSFYEILNNAKKQNSQISQMIPKIDSKELCADIEEITDTASKIIDTISKNPEKLDKAKNFFNYYLPVTLKILIKYDDIENQRLNNSDVNKFMSSTENMISKINKSFKVQLSNLYQTDMIDTDAEMKVFDSMLNLDGFNDLDNFNIKGGK